MSTKMLFATALALALLGVGLYIIVSVPAASGPGYGLGTSRDGEGVYCTMDAMLCPDGSYVGRTGPRCEFAECPSGGTSTKSSLLPGATKKFASLSGRVVLSPVCPVERVPADPACAPRPFQTVVEIRPTGRVSLLASTETDPSGSFKFSLEPGSYDILALGKNPFPRCEARTVVIASAASSSLELSCDTGIR